MTWMATTRSIATCIFRSPPRKFNEFLLFIHTGSGKKCGLETIVSDSVRFMRIFVGFPWRGAVKRQWNVGYSDFQCFYRYIFGNFRDKGNIVTQRWGPSSAFHWSQSRWPWMTLNDHFTLSSVLRQYVEIERLWLSKQVYSSFWRYKVYADIRGLSLKRRRQTTAGSCFNARAH